MKVDGVEVVNRNLLNMIDRGQDLQPAFDAIADLFAESEGKQFDTEGEWGSGRWAPLSPRYAAWKLKRFPGTKILERTGRLKTSLTRRPFGIEQISARRMTVGSNVSYATYHQRGRAHLPKRPPVAVPEQTKRAMIKTLQRYVISGAG